MDAIRLSKDHKIFVDFIDDEGNSVSKDVTDKGETFFFYPCILEEGLTLKDFLVIISKYREILSKLHERYYFDEFLDFLLSSEISFIDIEYIEICRYMNFNDEFYSKVTFSGRGIPLTKEMIENNSNYESYDVGEVISWGFIGVRDIPVDVPLKISDKIQIFRSKDKLEYINDSSITLMEAIHALFWEFSFYGNLETSDKFKEELNQRELETSDEFQEELDQHE